MALFGIGKKNKGVEEKMTKKPAPLPKAALKKEAINEKPIEATANFPIIRPRVTEKATDLEAKGVYCFDVLPNATKQGIARAIGTLYNVFPTKVRVVKVPRKTIFSRGKRGFKSGGKKAYIFLK